MNRRRKAAQQAAQTRKRRQAFVKAHAAEAASKAALRAYCAERGWKAAFFEGPTGAPRTGILDAIAFRVARGKPDVLDIRLIQLKGGNAGISGREIARLKKAVSGVNIQWCIAAFDGELLHLIPDELN